MESVMIFKLLDVLMSQPVHIFVISILVALLTGAIKSFVPLVKKMELTYFIPYILSGLAIFAYSAIMKIDLLANIGQIFVNGIYIALLSSIFFQLYKVIKDIGLKVFLKDTRTYKLYQELKNKLNSSISAICYAQKIASIDAEDLNSIIETMRGCGIEEKQLFSLANDLSIILSKQKKNKKPKVDNQDSLEDLSEGEVNDDKRN